MGSTPSRKENFLRADGYAPAVCIDRKLQPELCLLDTQELPLKGEDPMRKNENLVYVIKFLLQKMSKKVIQKDFFIDHFLIVGSNVAKIECFK